MHRQTSSVAWSGEVQWRHMCKLEGREGLMAAVEGGPDAESSLATRPRASSKFLLPAQRADATTRRIDLSRSIAVDSQASPACGFFLDLVSAILTLLTARASVPRLAMTATRNISYQLPERLKSNLQQSHRLP